MDQPSLSIGNYTTVCEWCAAPLDSKQNAVCDQCRQLLMRANLSDKQIFGSAPETEENESSGARNRE